MPAPAVDIQGRVPASIVTVLYSTVLSLCNFTVIDISTTVYQRFPTIGSLPIWYNI